MKKLCFALLALCTGTTLLAQDTDTTAEKKWTISGYGGLYYTHNFNKNATDHKTSFTNSDRSFEVGMLSVKIQHSLGKVRFTGDLGWGKRADAFSYNDRKSSVLLKQLYMDYTPVPWLQFTAGSFATYVGYELVDANLNRNYSMSYMFSYGPFFHTGVKAAVTVGDHTFMAGVFNPTDYKYAPPDSKKYIGGQWAFRPRETSFSAYLNYIGGEDTSGIRNDQLDLVLSYSFNPRFSIAYNGTYSYYRGEGPGAAWWGSALYLNLDCSEALGFTMRTEYFNDKDNLKVFTDKTAFANGGAIWAFTFSADYRLGPLRLIPEFRFDRATASLFTKNGQGTKGSPRMLVAAVYSF